MQWQTNTIKIQCQIFTEISTTTTTTTTNLLLYLIDHNVKLYCQNFKSYCQNQIKTTDTVNLIYLTFVQDNIANRKS